MLRASRAGAVKHALAVVASAALMGACNDAPEAPAMSNDAAKVRTELTPAILASIPDVDLQQVIVEYVGARINGDYEHEVAIVSELPIGAQALYITWLVETGVNNGGFEKYYFSTAGEFADQAVEAFEFFSAREHAALMRDANSVRALDAERKRLNRDADPPSQLGPLDARFRAMKEDLDALRIAKIRAMPELFSGK